MNFNFFRIGNIVSQPFKIGEIEEISKRTIKIKNHNFRYSYKETRPILLTEKILIDSKFISNPYEDRYELDDFHIDCDKTKGQLDFFESKRGFKITYIHELQNLYFLLKNKEIKIILNPVNDFNCINAIDFF